MANPPPDRPDVYVVARLLERLWRNGEPMLKTRLQVAANVNYDVFTRYFTWCLARRLVTIENSPDGHERIAITEKGKNAYRRLFEWINEFVHGSRPDMP